MTTTRSLAVMMAAAACAGALGVGIIKRAASDDPASASRPRVAPDMDRPHRARAERPESVWEKAALEQAAHDEATRTASIQRGAREQAAREASELERAAQEKNGTKQEVLDRRASERAARVEAALAAAQLGQALVNANENAAIATLRSIASAQAQCQAAQVIDTNADGDGEYAFLAEMAGTIPTRKFDPTGPIIGAHAIRPPVLMTAMGKLKDGGSGQGAIERAGYLFKVFLPDARGAGVAEAITGGATGVVGQVDAKLSEQFWCAYAWPITAGQSGTRVFFIHQDGDVWQHENAESNYDGTGSPPSFSDAYAGESMDSKAAQGWTPLD